jgi:ceramide glucosyltransferase
VTILKPLHGAEIGLYENLTSFCFQDYGGAVQIVLGVQDPSDPAIGIVRDLQAAFPIARSNSWSTAGSMAQIARFRTSST